MRIEYKILLFVFKALRDEAPLYLKQYLKWYEPGRPLRSEDQMKLTPLSLSTHTTTGDRYFAYAGPKLWNDLPLNIKKSSSIAIFKSSLKTLLFRKSYDL